MNLIRTSRGYNSLRVIVAILALFCFIKTPNSVFAAVSPGLTVVSGNGQATLEHYNNVPFVVQARDARGNLAPNVALTWTVSQGQGTVVSSDSRTDANGIGTATFRGDVTAGYSFSQQTVTVSSSLGSANFINTTIVALLPNRLPASMPSVDLQVPAQEDRTISGRSGTTIPRAIVVQVVSQNAPQIAPIANVSLRIVDYNNPSAAPPAQCTNQPLSDSNGFVYCDLLLTGSPGTHLVGAEVGEFRITPAIFLKIGDSAACTYSVSATSQQFTAAESLSSITVNTASGCTWTASSNASWITISSPSGSGSGGSAFRVSANTGSARSSSVVAGGQTLVLNQAGGGSIGVGPTLTIVSPATLPTAVINSPYTASLTASGGRAPYNWNPGAALPAGLTLNNSTGSITGTPSTTGTFTLPVNVTDQAGNSAAQTFSLSVAAASVQPGVNPTITNSSFPDATVGAAYQQVLTSLGGCASPFSAPPVYSVTGGALPAGLSLTKLDDRRYAISGTPSLGGPSNFNITVTDPCGHSGTSNFSLNVVGSGISPGPGAGSTLVVSQTSINASAQAGSAALLQPLSITTATGSVRVAVITGTVTGGQWLTVNASAADTPANLTVTLNPAGLQPAIYSGAIQIIPATPSAAPVAIPVRLQVLGPPSLSVAPVALAFVNQPAQPPPTAQTVSVNSTGNPVDVTVTAFAGSGGAWLFASPNQGTTPLTITVTVNANGLSAGTYQGAVVVTSGTQGVTPVSIPVAFTVQQAGPAITAVVNAANFQIGGVSPGEIVTVFGSSMGPSALVASQVNSLGALDSTLGETRVYFDGVPAPLIYSSTRQVSAIAPYAIAIRTSTRVEIEYRGVRSAPYDLPVVSSAPAIFTWSSGGQGPAAALNQDSSYNTANTGAEPGSIVVLYATGEGVTDPAGVDGMLAASVYPRPILPVRVTVGGLNADVLYAGAAPQLAAGLMQINVRLPFNLPAASAVPITLAVGDNSSQPGVTIFTK